MTQRTTQKRGFNLIEIAIVLAVIGLVIGGIYVAASAVTENNRRQVTQKELLQIVQTMRGKYASQPNIGTTALTYAQLKALAIMPGELQDTGTAFVNGYNGTVTVTAAAATDTSFIVTFSNLSQGACADLLSKPFGTTAAVSTTGLTAASVGGTAVTGVATGITAANAAAACATAGNANTVALTFNLR